MTRIIHAEMEVEGCDAVFSVNDLAVATVRHRLSVYRAIPIHELLLKDNSMQIRCLDSPSGPGTGRASLRITAVPLNSAPGGEGCELLASIELERKDGAGESEAGEAEEAKTATVPAETCSDFRVPTWPFSWGWASLPLLSWSDPDLQASALAFLEEFAARFSQGDAAWVAAVLRPKMEDYCHAYGISLQEEVQELQARMLRRSADPEFQVQPVKKEELSFTSCAGGRLLDCICKDGKAAVRWRDSRVGNDGSIALRIGIEGGSWRVFR